ASTRLSRMVVRKLVSSLSNISIAPPRARIVEARPYHLPPRPGEGRRREATTGRGRPHAHLPPRPGEGRRREATTGWGRPPVTGPGGSLPAYRAGEARPYGRLAMPNLIGSASSDEPPPRLTPHSRITGAPT